MADLEKKEIVQRLLHSTVNVISRRTSENYAAVTIGNVIRKLSNDYKFLYSVDIKNTQFSETTDIVNIKSSFDDVKIETIVNFSKDFIKIITQAIGSNAGYFFIKEVKEDLPFELEKKVKDIGIDLNVLHMEYLNERSATLTYDITHVDFLKYIFNAIFEVLNKEFGRNKSYKIVDMLVNRFNTEYELLRYVKVNDIRSVQDAHIVTVGSAVNSVDSSKIGDLVQKILQETNNILNDKGKFDFVESIRKYINKDYSFKMGELGVDLSALHMKKALIVRKTIKALIDVLSESTSESYAVLSIDKSLRKIYGSYDSLKYIKVDEGRYSEGFDAVSISSEIDNASKIEVGRSIQKLIETVSKILGAEAGLNFVDRLKKKLGKAYVLRLEQMGVNLHMVDLRQNFVW